MRTVIEDVRKQAAMDVANEPRMIDIDTVMALLSRMNPREAKRTALKLMPLDYDLRAEFLKHLTVQGKSEHTQRLYIKVVGDYLHSAKGKALDQMQTAVNYMAGLANKHPSSRAAHLYALRHFFKFLIAEGFTEKNPFRDLEVKRPRALVAVLSPSDVVTLLESVKGFGVRDRRDRAILELLYSSGLRVAELCGLNWRDIDFNEGTVKVLGKGNKERIVPVGETALKHLEAVSEETQTLHPG